MQSLLNVPAEVVLANINAAVAKAAVKRYWRKSAGNLLPDSGFCSIWF